MGWRYARGTSTDQISTTVASVLSEYFKSSERTIFWDEDLKANIDPFEGLEGGFFATDWDFKVCAFVVSGAQVQRLWFLFR